MADDVAHRRAEAEEVRVVAAVDEDAGPIQGRLQRAAAGPLADAQQTFNDALLRLVDALSVRVTDALRRAEAAERRALELEERLLRLERRGSGSALQTVAAQPRADALPDYFAYESRMRGSLDELRARQEPYVELLRDQAPVLDVGCGRGELLGLLRDAAVDARGVDADPDMVAFARGDGLAVEQADLLEALSAVEPESLGAVTAIQVVEHLPPATLVRFLELALRALRPGGILVAETINPVTPAALRHYFADLTHAQPLVAETLELLARHAGFAEVEVRLAEPQRPLAGTGEDERRISEQLFAPLDYVLIGRK